MASKQLEDKREEPFDLLTCEQWLVEMHEYFKSNPQMIINGFCSAGIVEVLKA